MAFALTGGMRLLACCLMDDPDPPVLQDAGDGEVRKTHVDGPVSCPGSDLRVKSELE